MTERLIAWLAVQLDDDERAAARIRRAPMHGVDSPAEKDYLRFADVDRVLAEVETKRRTALVAVTALGDQLARVACPI